LPLLCPGAAVVMVEWMVIDSKAQWVVWNIWNLL
jgi:hypothetical protein